MQLFIGTSVRIMVLLFLRKYSFLLSNQYLLDSCRGVGLCWTATRKVFPMLLIGDPCTIV